MTRQIAMIAAAALMLAPLAVGAQGAKNERLTYRCTSADGKKYYGSTIPRQCLGQPIDQLNARGIVIKRIDPVGEEKARLAKEAEEKRLREEADARREEQRRNRALLATYTSARDIEDSRRRALEDNRRAVQEIERRIEVLRGRRAGVQKEIEVYAGRGSKPPAKLAQDLRNVEIDLEAQEGLLASKQKDAEAINARYDDDRKRYLELTGGR